MKPTPTPSPRRLPRALATGIGVALIGGVVAAQTPPPAIEWDSRRLERLDRNVRKLERALTQRNAAGDPVLIAPDPEVVALMGRVDLMDQRLSDLESTLVRVNAETDNLNEQLDAAQRANRALEQRLLQTEARLTDMSAAAQTGGASEAAGVTEAGGMTARSPSGSEGGDFDAAMRLMRDGDYEGAADAFDLFVITWPDSPRVAEAHYRLAETRFIAEDNAGAVQAYARSLRGWPAAAWAPDATVKLADALLAGGQGEQACQALGEFERRYAARAAAGLRARATQLSTRAEC